jgi:hypothetical protein
MTSAFHPGHAGHGPHLGTGVGRFDIRDRPGGWAPQHRPSFGGRGGQASVGAQGNAMAFGDHGSRDRPGGEAGGSRPD